MTRIFITGATGNIGFEVIKSLNTLNSNNQIIAGVRNIDKAKVQFSQFKNVDFVQFDFENPDTFDLALNHVDRIFLLRPPHLADVKKYFNPLIEKLKEKSINEIVFLSVQGAEKSKVIPHNKIERLIKESNLDYIFLRPSYFMQNLTTTLLSDIKNVRKIILPSAKAKFNWVDVENIGEIASIILERFPDFKNQEIEVTGYENKDFYQVVELINEFKKEPILFDSVSPLKFYRIKKRDGMPKGMIMVMIFLHFLPRFQQEPIISDFYENLTKKKPTSLNDFLSREKDKFS